MKSTSQKLRQIWHDLFFKLGPKAVHFGMSCKDATHHADMHTQPHGWIGRFRLALHLSYCQACKNYFQMSQVFRKSIKTLVSQRPQLQLEKALNEKLILQFAKPKVPPEKL